VQEGERIEGECDVPSSFVTLVHPHCTGLTGLGFGEQWFLGGAGDDRFKTDDAEREASRRGDAEWRSVTRPNPRVFLLPGGSIAFGNGRCAVPAEDIDVE